MISITNLTKFYGTFKALDNINLKIEKGTIFGLIGPNGSGKTTLIKLLVGSLKPSYGEIKVFSLEPVKERSKLIKIIGYMPQDFALYEDLSVEENIKFFAKLHSIKNYEWVIEFAELESKRNVEVYKLSGGLKRRVSFTCSIVHNPTLLFLDEPTAALDPHLREKFWNYFLRLKEEGKTIFVSTHLMDEAFKCDLLGLIYKGKMLMVDKPENILKIGNLKIELEFENENKFSRILENNPKSIAGFLKQFGLDEKVKGLNFKMPNLDEVIVSIFKEEVKE